MAKTLFFIAFSLSFSFSSENRKLQLINYKEKFYCLFQKAIDKYKKQSITIKIGVDNFIILCYNIFESEERKNH